MSAKYRMGVDIPTLEDFVTAKQIASQAIDAYERALAEQPREKPAPPLLCPERKRHGGTSEQGTTYLINMDTGDCANCGWPPDKHVRALAAEQPREKR